ncbi:MAG: FAD binding domain-containing protein [Candidatus Promineifilaceae bacterium]
MPPKPSVYYRPQSLSEALKYLEQPDAKPLGGGTKLIAGGFSGAAVDLQDIGLSTLDYAGGKLIVGAMTKLVDLSEYISEKVLPSNPEDDAGAGRLLLGAIHRAGPNTYRNMATMGGMLASRLPDSEFQAALLVLEAEIILADGSIIMSTDFINTSSLQGGLIVEVQIPWISGRSAAERVARTPADYPIVSITVFQPQSDDIRLASTGIDDVPVRLSEAEMILRSKGGHEEAAAAARNRSRHPGDFRGGAEYRAEMAYVLTKRALMALS